MKEKQIKAKMFYARSYRHLSPDYKMMAFYYLFCLLPCIIIYLFSYSKITLLLSKWVVGILSDIVPEVEVGISKGDFLYYFGEVHFVTLPSKLPSFTFIIINLIITMILLLVFSVVKDGAKPVAIYATIALLVHLVSCSFFLFLKDRFPYSLAQYSELYMQQQVGIWLSFFVIAGLVSGFIRHSGISKYLMLFMVIAYSFLFGCLRYIVFLVFLLKASSLYMAMLFFSFGPFFDFLYLVCIYSIYINNLTFKFHDKEGGAEWHWA